MARAPARPTPHPAARAKANRGATILRYLVTSLAILLSLWAAADLWSGGSDPVRSSARRIARAAAARFGLARRGSAGSGAAAAPAPPPDTRRAVALIVLCRESEADDLTKTMASFDEAYNSRFLHDYVIFIDGPAWGASTVAMLANATRARVRFHALDERCDSAGGCEWGVPSWIDRRKFSDVLTKATYYGNTEAYRKMCRFFAGPAFRTRILDEYRWVWRLDSHVRYLCDIVDDPIARLESSDAVYGFALRMNEKMDTIPSLWTTVEDWALAHGRKQHLRDEWGVTIPGHVISNGCHYWNNFEIAKVDFFRGDDYQALFRALDTSGGFFYERWGDAPVRSWALSVLARKSQVVYFEEVGYQHPWWFKCPPPSAVCWRKGKPLKPGHEGDGAGCLPYPEIQPHTYTDGHMCDVPS